MYASAQADDFESPGTRSFGRQKNGRSDEGAAKFREETPRKGGGITERKSAIPRCSNVADLVVGRKEKLQGSIPVIYMVFLMISAKSESAA